MAHVLALTLDMVGPISEVLDQLNMAAEGGSEEIELDLEKFARSCTKTLQVDGGHQHKKLVPNTVDQEEHLTA